MKFRERHQAEIHRFRACIGKLTEELRGSYPSVEAHRQAIQDTYRNEVGPAISELRDALRDVRLKVLADYLRAAVFTSAPTLTAQVTMGPIASTATLLVAAGLSLTAVHARYRIQRRELLRKDAYSFVLAAQAEFGERMARRP